MSLFLIGPRGAGKSTAGRLAADQLGVPFVDSDRLVEQRAKMEVPAIFEQLGEPAFREREREAMLDLLDRRGCLMIATGGGCVLDAEVRRRLEDHQGVIWLWAPPEVLSQRIVGSSRPPLGEPRATLEEEMDTLVAQREPLYRGCADQRVGTADRSVEEVVHVIKHFWQILPHHIIR